jgi:DnaJ like chaperone protein
MSVWGKVSGAAAGLFVGGPVGAVVGAVVGHFFLDQDSDPGVTFTIALVALAGKMARADGVATDQEFEVFRKAFGVPAQEEKNVQRIFNLARQDIAGFEYYAGQIARLFVGNPAMLEDVLDGLFEIAKADGVLHPGEAAFLEKVAEIFADDEELKQAYRRLVRENHPDSLMARGVPQEFIKLANDKLAAINNAYEKIRAERGLP